VIDGVKFISVVAKLPPGSDPMQIFFRHQFTETAYKIGTILTIPAAGSEWNCGFVISRRSHNFRVFSMFPLTYPVFSLLDPRYTSSLPPNQLRNSVFDAFTHVIDSFVTPKTNFMSDGFYISVIREMVAIGPEVVKEGSSFEL
jgi:NADP-dependent alcohol dehydrogenase